MWELTRETRDGISDNRYIGKAGILVFLLCVGTDLEE